MKDLFYEAWKKDRQELKGINDEILYETYKNGATPDEAYMMHVYLPF